MTVIILYSIQNTASCYSCQRTLHPPYHSLASRQLAAKHTAEPFMMSMWLPAVLYRLCLQVLVPPTIIPMVEGWLQQAGNESALQAPDDLWLSATAPVPGSVSGQPATQTSGVQDSAAASSKAAPVTSAADAMRASLSAMLMSLLVISAAAAAML